MHSNIQKEKYRGSILSVIADINMKNINVTLNKRRKVSNS